MPLFVLLHSPLVGPGTWSAVAGQLTALGHRAVVPSLLAVGDGRPPFWPRVVSAVTQEVPGGISEAASGTLAEHPPGTAGGGSGGGSRQAAGNEPLVLVAHSNAGVFVPVVRHALADPVQCSVFADAIVPAAGATGVVEAEFLAFLRGLTGPGGRLPRWTDWWPEEDLAALFPSQDVRELVTREQPQLPLAYFEEQVPVPDGWDDHPCWYLQFSPAYNEMAQRAAQRGWPVRSLPGGHLHPLIDPAAVARALLDMAESSP